MFALQCFKIIKHYRYEREKTQTLNKETKLVVAKGDMGGRMNEIDEGN